MKTARSKPAFRPQLQMFRLPSTQLARSRSDGQSTTPLGINTDQLAKTKRIKTL